MRGNGNTLGQAGEALLSATPDGRQANSQGLGSALGAPMRTEFATYPIIPIAQLTGNNNPVQVVPATRPSKLVTFMAPDVDFLIYIGGPGVRGGGIDGMALPPGVSYSVPIAGNQPIYAVTDSPVPLRLRVQIAPLLGGDTERQMG